MAKGGDKKILQSNKSRLSVLLKVIVGVNVSIIGLLCSSYLLQLLTGPLYLIACLNNLCRCGSFSFWHCG